jgi:hypothetical protein
MINQRTVLEPLPHAAALRQLAGRAHRVLSRPGEKTAEHELREIRAMLQQIAHLRQGFQPHRRTPLQRWLTEVEKQIKAYQERVLQESHLAGRPGADRKALDCSI